MTPETLLVAIAEARRFIDAAEKVEIIHDKYDSGKTYEHLEESSAANAACKRASMDLTRALANLRKSR